MPFFHRFGPGDIVDTVVTLSPSHVLVSGSAGWRGGVEGGGIAYLEGGIRRSGIVQETVYQSLQGVHNGTAQFDDPRRRAPASAAVSLVYLTDEDIPSGSVTNTRWGDEHWGPIANLYDYYGRIDPDYTTASYDFYCVFLQKDSRNVLGSPAIDRASGPLTVSSSFTVEAWVKPFLTASATNDFTVFSYGTGFWFGITGSTGRLAFSSSQGVFTSSFGPEERRWSHVSVRSDNTTVSFSIDLLDAGSSIYHGVSYSDVLGGVGVGNVLSGTAGFQYSWPSLGRGQLLRSFHGLISEVRLWNSFRTLPQVSSSYNVRLTRPFEQGLELYYPMREGPLGFSVDRALLTAKIDTPENMGLGSPAGSGTVDLVHSGTWDGSTGYVTDLYLCGFDDRTGPRWHPCDNPEFITDKRLSTDPVTRLAVVHVPSMFYGRQIATGSVELVCRAYSSGSFGLVRTLVDDGRGGLYISGSVCSSSLAAREGYPGVEWNKVGNVFYSEGLVVIKDPALIDIGGRNGQYSAVAAPTTELLQLSFRGVSRLPSKVITCRLEPGDANCSANSTFSSLDSDGHLIRTAPSGSVYITTVGLYDGKRRLVGLARLASPMRKRDRDRLAIRLRMDF